MLGIVKRVLANELIEGFPNITIVNSRPDGLVQIRTAKELSPDFVISFDIDEKE